MNQDIVAQQRRRTKELTGPKRDKFDAPVDPWAALTCQLIREGWSVAAAGPEAERRLATGYQRLRNLQRWLLAASILAIVVIVTLF